MTKITPQEAHMLVDVLILALLFIAVVGAGLRFIAEIGDMEQLIKGEEDANEEGKPS